jgi:type IV secretory pathway VirB10-like protein
MKPFEQARGTKVPYLLLVAAGVIVAVAAISWRGLTANDSNRAASSSRGASRHRAPGKEAHGIEQTAPAQQKSVAAEPSPPAQVQHAPTRAAALLPELESPVLAATRARQFAAPAEELAFWTERIRGERLTLTSRQRSLANAERVLARGDLTENQVEELERRKALLQVKVEQQARQVGEIEQRIAEIKKNGANDGT